MRMSTSRAFALQVSIIIAFLAGSSAPTPLYAAYQAAWGFTPITITVVFGIYAVAVLAALLVTGSLSDFVGRRPVLIVAAVAQALAMIVFATAGGVTALVVARVIQGLATGAAASAVGAAMLDIDRERGTVANSVAPTVGTASGALISGFLVQYLPAPTTLVYVVLAGVFVAQAVGLVYMPETVQRRAGALASLRPHLRLPREVRGAMLVAAPALVASWALAGFYGSLGPSVVCHLANSHSLFLGGSAFGVIAGSGSLASYLARNMHPRAVLLLGTALLIGGVGTTLIAIPAGSVVGFFVGGVAAGAGFGASFQGAIRTVMPLAGSTERAGVLSILYVLAYLAMGVPAVIGGVRVVHGGGLFTTAREYGLVVMALAAVAFAGTWLTSTARARARVVAQG